MESFSSSDEHKFPITQVKDVAKNKNKIVKVKINTKSSSRSSKNKMNKYFSNQ